jgi:hypothetical protein
MPKASTPEDISVVSHVGRDVLQSAQLFAAPETAVWEYVVNGLQYTDGPPLVEVRILTAKRAITIRDHGTGMNREDLQHFFTMHGENRERRAGRGGRGKFGTGKSAAFGIGDELVVDTVRHGLRNVVRVTRRALEQSDGQAVPVEDLVINESTSDESGTLVTIGGLSPQVRVRSTTLVRFFERHLAAWRTVSARVLVDDVEIEVHEPRASFERTFTPIGNIAEVLGDLPLTVKASPIPVEEHERGVAVTAGVGNLVAIVTAGVESKQFGTYLFGTVDCPALDQPLGTVAAYASNRDLTLNLNHPVAAALVAFIGSSLESVRTELVAEERARRREAENKRLDGVAQEIADVLNADLAEQLDRIERLGSNVRRQSPLQAPAGGDESDPDDPSFVLEPLGDLLGRQDGDLDVDPPHPTGEDVGGGGGGEGGTTHSPEAAVQEEDGATPIATTPSSGARRRRGGVEVRFDYLGKDEHRARIDMGSGVLFINLDHPTVAAAKEADGGTESITFRRLAYETAFTEYAMYLARLEAARNPAIEAGDILFEIREGINRVALAAIGLYRDPSGLGADEPVVS